MTDEIDYEPDWDDLYDDDLIGPPKEEPNCGTCWDSGIEGGRRGRKCRECRPSRLRVWWWDRRWRVRRWRNRWRRSAPDDPWGPPF